MMTVFEWWDLWGVHGLGCGLGFSWLWFLCSAVGVDGVKTSSGLCNSGRE